MNLVRELVLNELCYCIVIHFKLIWEILYIDAIICIPCAQWIQSMTVTVVVIKQSHILIIINMMLIDSFIISGQGINVPKYEVIKLIPEPIIISKI